MTDSKRAGKVAAAERPKPIVETAIAAQPGEDPDDFDWAFDMKPKAKGKP
jgi:hypothetical protein